MTAIRAGIYYRHIFDGRGYPRDVLALSKAVNGEHVETLPTTGFRQFVGRLDVKQIGLDILIDGYTEYPRSGGRYRCFVDQRRG